MDSWLEFLAMSCEQYDQLNLLVMVGIPSPYPYPTNLDMAAPNMDSLFHIDIV
jgi:hypothetical protein